MQALELHSTLHLHSVKLLTDLPVSVMSECDVCAQHIQAVLELPQVPGHTCSHPCISTLEPKTSRSCTA